MGYPVVLRFMFYWLVLGAVLSYYEANYMPFIETIGVELLKLGFQVIKLPFDLSHAYAFGHPALQSYQGLVPQLRSMLLTLDKR